MTIKWDDIDITNAYWNRRKERANDRQRTRGTDNVETGRCVDV